jgi:hypothetical protein
MSGRNDSTGELPKSAVSPELAASHALSALQIEFAATLLDASRTSALMEKLSRADEAVLDPSLSRLNDRVGLYRGNVHAHRRAALANAYPVLLSLVGDDYFDALSRAYGLAYPSQSGDLNQFGGRLATFIATYESNPKFAYFSDMARLEWALHQAHYAQDVTPFTADDWASVGDGLLDARLAVHPACVAIESSFAIADIWLAHQPGGEFPAAIEAPSYALVVRPAWQAGVLIQPEAAHRAFVALQDGRTLNEALDIAFSFDETFDFATQWKVWVEGAVVGGVRENAATRVRSV